MLNVGILAWYTVIKPVNKANKVNNNNNMKMRGDKIPTVRGNG